MLPCPAQATATGLVKVRKVKVPLVKVKALLAKVPPAKLPRANPAAHPAHKVLAAVVLVPLADRKAAVAAAWAAEAQVAEARVALRKCSAPRTRANKAAAR